MIEIHSLFDKQRCPIWQKVYCIQGKERELIALQDDCRRDEGEIRVDVFKSVREALNTRIRILSRDLIMHHGYSSSFPSIRTQLEALQ